MSLATTEQAKTEPQKSQQTSMSARSKEVVSTHLEFHALASLSCKMMSGLTVWGQKGVFVKCKCNLFVSDKSFSTGWVSKQKL